MMTGEFLAPSMHGSSHPREIRQFLGFRAAMTIMQLRQLEGALAPVNSIVPQGEPGCRETGSQAMAMAMVIARHRPLRLWRAMRRRA